MASPFCVAINIYLYVFVYLTFFTGFFYAPTGKRVKRVVISVYGHGDVKFGKFAKII